VTLLPCRLIRLIMHLYLHCIWYNALTCKDMFRLHELILREGPLS